MKILIDLERLRYPNSGIANVFKHLAEGIENKKCKFLGFYYFGKESELRKISPTIQIIKWKPWHKFFENFSKNYDLIHASHQHSSYFHCVCNKSKKILTLHDLNFLYENLKESKKQELLKRVNKNLKNTDYLVCISDFVKQDVIRNQHLLELGNVKEILVIHNGIKLPENNIYNLGKFDFLKEKKYILNIGVLFEKKNQLSLIKMLPFLEEDLVLVASDEKEPYASEVKCIISELKLENRVHFLSEISENEKYALIQHCQAMCHPSLAEGFGIPPIEAMVFGKPVFLSKLTSLPEIGGKYAFYFENFNAEEMAKCYQLDMKYFRENQIKLEQEIKTWALQYDYKIMTENYMRLYKNILEY